MKKKTQVQQTKVNTDINPRTVNFDKHKNQRNKQVN